MVSPRAPSTSIFSSPPGGKICPDDDKAEAGWYFWKTTQSVQWLTCSPYVVNHGRSNLGVALSIKVYRFYTSLDIIKFASNGV